MADYDVVVVGAGVAGLAATIAARMRGLSVLILCSKKVSRTPGEFVDGTAEILLSQLGVISAVKALNPIRVYGHWIQRKAHSSFLSHLRAAHPETLVVPRDQLHEVLNTRALELGAVLSHCTSVDVSVAGWCVDPNILVDGKTVNAKFVIDATGRQRLLARRHGLLTEKHSPPLLAFYGYRNRNDDYAAAAPVLQFEADGWTWTAPAGPRETSLTRLTWNSNKRTVLQELRFDRRWTGIKVQAVDVTWSIVSKPAGAAFFLVGDAAYVLDPGAGNGIVRALSSSIIAANLIASVLEGNANKQQAAQLFNDYIWHSFEEHKSFLSQAYSFG